MIEVIKKNSAELDRKRILDYSTSFEVEIDRFVNQLNEKIIIALKSNIPNEILHFELWGFSSDDVIEKGIKLFEKEGWVFLRKNVWCSFGWRVNIEIQIL